MPAFQLGPLFWQSITREEFGAIVRRDGLLTEAQTRRAWQMVGGMGAPPIRRFRILINKADAIRHFSEWQQKRRPN